MNKKRGPSDVQGCVSVEFFEGTAALYGNEQATLCGHGDGLLYCPLLEQWTQYAAGVAGVQCTREVPPAYVDAYWRTCSRCPRTTRVVRNTQGSKTWHQCHPCIGRSANLASAVGEVQSSADASTCEACPGCSYLDVEFVKIVLEPLLTPEGSDEDAKRKYLREQRAGSSGNGVELYDAKTDWTAYEFSVLEPTVRCVPVPRRFLQFETATGLVQVAGTDQYKVRKTIMDETDPFREVYALYKLVDMPERHTFGSECEKVTCATACGEGVFAYADRCGPQPAEKRNNVYVQSDELVMKMEDALAKNYLRESNVNLWRVKHEGLCRPCFRSFLAVHAKSVTFRVKRTSSSGTSATAAWRALSRACV